MAKSGRAGINLKKFGVGPGGCQAVREFEWMVDDTAVHGLTYA